MVDKTTASGSEPNQDSGEGKASTANLTKEEVSQMINTAIGQRLRSFQDDFKGFKTTLDEISQRVSSSAPSQESEASPKSDPKLEMMATKLKAFEKERSRIRDKGLRAAAREEFIKHNINPDAVEPLLALHIDARKSIGYAADDTDDVVMTLGENTFSLTDGVAHLVKNEPSMKAFLAPKGASGSGETRFPPPANNQEAPNSLNNFFKRAMK